MPSFSHLDSSLAINPSAEQAAQFMQLDPNGPAVIVNFHEHWPEARYPEEYNNRSLPRKISGREAYHRYLRGVLTEIFPREPGAYLRVAPADMVLIGSGNWHEIVIGYYPTRAVMFRIASTPGYADHVVHRTAGLKAVHTVACSSDPFDPLQKQS